MKFAVKEKKLFLEIVIEREIALKTTKQTKHEIWVNMN